MISSLNSLKIWGQKASTGGNVQALHVVSPGTLCDTTCSSIHFPARCSSSGPLNTAKCGPGDLGNPGTAGYLNPTIGPDR